MSVAQNAPSSLAQFAKSIDREIDGAIWPFISREPYTRSQLTAAMATQFPSMFALVSDGTSNRHVAQSDGSAFRYLDGNAV